MKGKISSFSLWTGIYIHGHIQQGFNLVNWRSGDEILKDIMLKPEFDN